MKTTTQSNNRLGGYLTAAVSVGTLASSSHAAIVTLNTSIVSGPNGGVPATAVATVNLNLLSPGLTGYFGVWNAAATKGISGTFYTYVAPTGPGLYASPRKFASNDLIDGTSVTGYINVAYTAFRSGVSLSSDFGPSSYIGFRSENNHYGYLEVTWSSATDTFQILGGAYEDQPGLGVRAGSLTSIPEPSTAMLSLGALTAGSFIRRRKQAA